MSGAIRRCHDVKKPARDASFSPNGKTIRPARLVPSPKTRRILPWKTVDSHASDGVHFLYRRDAAIVLHRIRRNLAVREYLTLML